MKVQEIIKLLERDGWYLKHVEVIDNTSIRQSQDVLRCRDIRMMTFRRVL